MQTEFIKNCPKCSSTQKYKSEGGLKQAIKNNTLCRSCGTKSVYLNNPSFNKGENNPMFGTYARKIWEETLTRSQIDEKINKRRALQVKNTAGKNNPMFGKPSPPSSGHGISGEWNGISFRSLLELAFIEWFFLSKGYMPQSAEGHVFKIKLPSGRNYFPDFVDKDGNIYEVKPRKLVEANSEKIKAGIKKFGKKFILVTEDELNYKDIDKRLDSFNGLGLNTRKNKSKSFKAIELLLGY